MSRRDSAWRYVAALLVVGAALLLRWPLYAILGGHRPYLTIFGAVALAVWLSRWKPAALAAAVGFFLAHYFLVPAGEAPQSTLYVGVELLFYALSTGLIIFVGEAMHRGRERALREAQMRRTAEEEERGQKELLRVTLLSIGDGVIVADRQGLVLSLNAEAEKLTGWTGSEAAGRPLTEVFRVVNEDTGQPVEDPVAKVFRVGTVAGLANHTVLISRSGQSIPIDDSAAPIQEVGGSLLGVVLVFRSVSEARAAQRARAHLASIVEHSGDAIITKDLEGTIHSWNASAERLFGWRADEVVGRSVTVLIPQDRIEEESFILARLRAGEPVERMETVRVTKDGRQIPVALTVSPIRDSEGQVIGASKVAHDITEVVAGREALAEEQELLKITLASIGDAVVTTDERGTITYLNPVAESVTGWTPSDAIGQPLDTVFRIVNEDTRQPAENPVTRVLREGIVVGLANHTVLIRRDGSERPIDDSAAPIRDAHGSIVGCVLVFRDIADRKRAAYEIERLLAGERAARSALEQANRLKDDFLATVSHELRTPLNAILGWSQLISANPSDPKNVSEGVSVITRNAKNQAELIADLLDMSRIVSGKLWLDVGEVNLTDVVRAGIDAVRPSSDAKGTRIESDLGQGPVMVRGEAARLQQVVWNLLSNAVKFTPTGGRVDVSLRANDGTATIVVRDTGIGINPEFLPRVFERFRQGDASVARAHGGLGLGLAIVKHLVELHGGTVAAESTGPGHGATFRVELPLWTAPELNEVFPQAESRAIARRGTTYEEVNLSGVRVLAVDDHEDSRVLITRALEECGAEVVEAASGERGLELLEKLKPHIVLCDIGMPVMDGYQFISLMRARADTTPALAVTAFARPEDRLRALRAGYQAHITKPIDPAELIATISVFVKPSKGTTRSPK